MALKDDLKKDVDAIFRTSWEKREGRQVPAPEDVKLGNDAVTLKGTVLYADLAESTNLVDTKKDTFAAEVYKSYLHCAAKIIRDEGGEITAFDGDRVMGVFIGDSKNTQAARCALKINHAVVNIINPSLKAVYTNSTYVVKQAVGVDTSDLFIARTGIRGSNDLVWVGRAANYAAKLCSLREGSYRSWITETVYSSLHDSVKFHEGRAMWERVKWDEKDIYVYRSAWSWAP